MNLVHKVKDKVTEKVSTMKKPEASVKDFDLKDVSRDGITYLTKISVKNPYDVTIPICEIQYSLKSVDRVIASGKVPDPGSLKGHEDTVLDVGMKVPHSVLVSLMKDIGSDWDVDYVIEIKLIFDIPVFGNITIPLTQKGEMKLPTLSDLF